MIDLSGVFPAAQSMSWGFPENVAVGGDRIDRLFWWMMIVLTPFLLAVCIFLAYCLVKFRAREGHRATYITGFKSAAGTAGIAVLLMLMELPFDVVQEKVWADMTVRFPKPEDATVVQVFAEQFAWNFRHAGGDGKFGTEDDLTYVNKLVVPSDKPVLCLMRSRDVIHSFWLPHFRVKMDVMPGVTHKAWFTPVKTGKLEVACAELCGLGHYKMAGVILVKSPADFAKWLKDEAESLKEDGPGDERKKWDLWKD
jgi:cytochrome c oxidase subunit 2